MDRVPFGRECRLALGPGPACPVCGARRGDLHAPGCQAAECPECGEPAILCGCGALSVRDEARIIKALYETFADFHGAMEVAREHMEADNLLHRAAMGLAYRHAPEELKAKFAEGWRQFFPFCRPCGYSGDGQAFYSAADLAEALGLPLEDVDAMVETLLDPEERGQGAELNLIQ